MINLIYTENIYNITDYGYADNLLSFFIQDFFLYEALLEIVHYQHIIAICHHNFEWLFYIFFTDSVQWWSKVCICLFFKISISDLEGDGFCHFLCDSVIDRFVSGFLEFLRSIYGILQLSPQVCRSGSCLLSVHQSLVSFRGVWTQGVGLTCINARSTMYDLFS